MRMQLEAAEVRHPGERRGVARHQLLGAAAGGKLEFDHLDPLRPALGRALLEEKVAIDAVRIAHQHVRPATRTTQRAVRQGHVIPGHIELGDLRGGKEQLRRVGDHDLAAADLQDLGARLLLHFEIAAAASAEVRTGTISKSTRSSQLAVHCAKSASLSVSMTWKQRLKSMSTQLAT